MPRSKAVFGVFAAVILSLVLFIALGGRELALMSPSGLVALKERNLILTATFLMLIVVIPVIVMTYAFAWKYREDNKGSKYSPEWANDPKLEAIWWGIPIIIVATLAVITWKSTHDLDPFKPLSGDTKPLRVQVVALDWKWLFIYPELGIATINYVEIPVDTPIDLSITADAPMNSFWIPKLAGQIYAMPGMQTQLHIIANEAGDYQGVSSNFSGSGFSGMKFTARAASADDFAKWAMNAEASTLRMNDDEYTEIAKPSENDPERTFALLDPDLFDKIMMKFNVPQVTETSSSTDMNNEMMH